MRSAALIALVVGAALVGVGSAAGQAPDTLRYREVTTSTMRLRTPQGEVSVGSDHDATIAVLRLTADSLHAWYDRISVSATSPVGEERPDLTEVLGDRFVLRMGPRGRIETLRTPTFPESLQGITDLRFQFLDFFPLKPAAALRPGLAWTDTIALVQDGTEAAQSGATRKIVRFEVIADSVVGGVPTIRIRGASTIEIRSEGPVPGQASLRVRMTLSGPETETVWLDRATGTMVARERSATLTGEMAYVGGPRTVTLAVERSDATRIGSAAPAAR